MTKKQFEAIAAAIKAEFDMTPPEQQFPIRMVASRMAAIFAQENPRFDREKFLSACGVRP